MRKLTFFLCAALCLVLCPGISAAETTPASDDPDAVAAVSDQLVPASSVAKDELKGAVQEVITGQEAELVFGEFEKVVKEYFASSDAEVHELGLDGYFEQRIVPTLDAHGVSSAARKGLKSMLEAWIEAETRTHR